MGLRFFTPEEAEDYQNIIDSYHPSAQTVYDFARSRFAVIAGPTGAGKDTVRTKLLGDSADFIKILSSTSRPMRPGEQDGVEYHFRELEYFDQGLDERRFLQAALVHKQQISCLDITEINKLNQSQTGLSILIVQTEDELRRLNPDMKTIFIIPPTLEELMNRINTGKNLAPDELFRRLEAAKLELQFALKHPDYYCLINDNLETTCNLASQYLREDVRDTAQDAKAREVIDTILNKLSIDN